MINNTIILEEISGSIREENKYEKRASLTRVRMNINMAGMTLEQKHQYPVPINDNMLVRDSKILFIRSGHFGRGYKS